MTPPDEIVPAGTPAYEPEVHWDVRIPVRDGLELSANLWRPSPPAGSAGERFPVILEMIPYGKDSWRLNWDTAFGEWLAARGFALCRLDVRGTGSSPGVALDEYTEDETRDGYDAVEWLAAQPWCNGNVGMWGISYGGFTALQVAKLRPPHLRAILPMYATDDRYLDDVHLRGGCVTASEKSQYAVSQLGMNALPPRPDFRGDGWRDEWRARLEATPPWLFPWIREQTDGPYWRRGSLAPEYQALECPVFQVAGWSDAYVDPAFRIQERCVNAERRTIVGNWVHSFPDDAYPGPNIDWLRELVRFFDHYLRGVDNGWEREPALTWFEREWARPEAFPTAWPGRWRAADAFPLAGTEPLELVLDEDAFSGERVLRSGGWGGDPDSPQPSQGGSDTLAYRATVGTAGGLSWGAGWPPNGLARDLRPDEASGLTYTSEALREPISILGVPEVDLWLWTSMPVATCVVRLSDVAPDGTSSLVATGALNLTHRRSDTHPTPMPAERRTAELVRIPLRTSGYRFAVDHQVRLTVLGGYWPVLWPSPFPGTMRVFRGFIHPSRLLLPVIPDDAALPAPPAFGPPAAAALREVGSSEADPPGWRIEEDVLTGTVSVTIDDGGASIAEDGARIYSAEHLRLTASDADPALARLAADVVYRWTVDGADIDIRATGIIASDAEAFDVEVELDVQLDGAPFFAREWRERIPRRLV